MVSTEITDLMAYTNYTVQVAAVDDRGQEGPRSLPVSTFTPEAGMLSQVYTLCEREISLMVRSESFVQ